MFENLSFFARLMLFPHLFFASSVVVTDGGAGDGGGGDDGGAGGGDDGGDGDDGGGDDDAGEIGDLGEEGDEGTGDEGDELDEGDEGQEGGRRVDTKGITPKEIKAAIEELKKINPKVAEIARRGIYENGDYRRAVGTVAQAREIADTFESLGGHEGIESMQTEVNDYARELKSMADGDPQAIEDLAHDFPGGLVKLVPHAVAKMRQIDEGSYDHLRATISSELFGEKGIFNTADRIAELISDGKQKEALELTNRLRGWMTGVKEIAGKRPQSREESPESREARETLERANTKEANIFKGQVASVVIKGMNDSITAALAPQIKSLKLSSAQKDALLNRVRTRLSRVFERDDRYQDRMAQLLDGRDINAIRRFLRGRLDRKMVKKAVARELALGNFRVRSSGGGSAGGRSATGGTGGATGAAMVTKKPSPDQIDWTKDRSRMRFTGQPTSKGRIGEATLKTGKVVRWNWDEQ